MTWHNEWKSEHVDEQVFETKTYACADVRLGCGHVDTIVVSDDMTPEDARALGEMIVCRACAQWESRAA